MHSGWCLLQSKQGALVYPFTCVPHLRTRHAATPQQVFRSISGPVVDPQIRTMPTRKARIPKGCNVGVQSNQGSACIICCTYGKEFKSVKFKSLRVRGLRGFRDFGIGT